MPTPRKRLRTVLKKSGEDPAASMDLEKAALPKPRPKRAIVDAMFKTAGKIIKRKR